MCSVGGGGGMSVQNSCLSVSQSLGSPISTIACKEKTKVIGNSHNNTEV